MKVLLTTCLLFALRPAVASLICEQCVGKNEACDNPMEIDCAEDEDSCLNYVAHISIHGFTLMTVSAKTCVNSKFWREGTYFLATEENISIIGKVEVCQTDMCNKKNLHLPCRSELPQNGRECPACLTLNSDRCEAQKKISCRGNETKCLIFGATGTAPEDVEYNVGFRGCATPNSCKNPTGEMDMAGGMITTNITHQKCTNAPMSPSALEGFAPHLLWSSPFMGMKQRPQRPGN